MRKQILTSSFIIASNLMTASVGLNESLKRSIELVDEITKTSTVKKPKRTNFTPPKKKRK